MPLLGGDSNSYWRFDLKLFLKAFGVLLLLRGITILAGIFPQYIPVFDDIIGAFFELIQWLAISFNRVASRYMDFS